MRAEQIEFHRRAAPFQPFRVYLSDGSAYDVYDSQHMFVTHREVVIGLDPGPEHLPRRSVYCDPIHITRIEPLGAITTGAGGSAPST